MVSYMVWYMVGESLVDESAMPIVFDSTIIDHLQHFLFVIFQQHSSSQCSDWQI